MRAGGDENGRAANGDGPAARGRDREALLGELAEAEAALAELRAEMARRRPAGDALRARHPAEPGPDELVVEDPIEEQIARAAAGQADRVLHAARSQADAILALARAIDAGDRIIDLRDGAGPVRDLRDIPVARSGAR